MKNATKLISLLLIFALGCNETERPKPTIFIGVMDEVGQGVSGATVEVYGTADDWLNGATPIFTAFTNANGQVEASKDFGTLTSMVIFAEKNSLNNWPGILTTGPITKGSDGIFSGSASIYESLLPEFEGASTKSYLLTDFRNSSGVSVFNSVSACSKDNTIKLGVNMIMSLNENSLVCPGMQPVKTIQFFVGNNKTGYQTSHNGLIMYNFPLPGQSFQLFVNTSFTKLYLYENGTEAEYTRQN